MLKGSLVPNPATYKPPGVYTIRFGGSAEGGGVANGGGLSQGIVGEQHPPPRLGPRSEVRVGRSAETFFWECPQMP